MRFWLRFVLNLCLLIKVLALYAPASTDRAEADRESKPFWARFYLCFQHDPCQSNEGISVQRLIVGQGFDFFSIQAQIFSLERTIIRSQLIHAAPLSSSEYREQITA